MDTDGAPEELDVEEPKVPEDAPPSDGGGGIAEKTPEELIAKAIAPVKREFLRPPPIRPCSNSNETNDAASGAKSAPYSSLLKEKKSKRQLKRERLQVLYIYLINILM